MPPGKFPLTPELRGLPCKTIIDTDLPTGTQSKGNRSGIVTVIVMLFFQSFFLRQFYRLQ